MTAATLLRGDGDSQGGSDMPGGQLYDSIGATYTVTRRTELRILPPKTGDSVEAHSANIGHGA